MKNNYVKTLKYGFFLVELLVYIAVASIFFLLLFQFTVLTYNQYSIFTNLSSKKASAYMAIDLISNDLRKASSYVLSWKLIDNSNLIWNQDGKTDIGWLLKENKLYRFQGTYLQASKMWKDKTESLVCTNVSKFNVIINKPGFLVFDSNQISKDGIKSIVIILEVNFKNKNISLQKTICPKAGIIK